MFYKVNVLYTVSRLRQSAQLSPPLGAAKQRRAVTTKAAGTVQNIQEQRLQARNDEEDAVHGGLLKW